MPLVMPVTNAIFVGLEATAVFPNANPWVPITNTNAVSQPFKDALLDLPAQGGVLYVMPGSSPYVFDQVVPVNKPNVTIHFVGGSELTFPPSSILGPTALFQVTHPNFHCHGARVKFVITDGSNVDDRSCFLVETDDASFLDCLFDVQQLVGPSVVIRSFSCIRQDATDPEIHKGLRVARTTFVVQPGNAQSAAWTLDPIPQPRGICCIRASRLRGCVLVENQFRSGSSTVKGDCGPVILLDAVEECSLSTATFRGLKTPTSGSGADRGAIVRLRKPGLEGHHTVLSSLVFEALDTAHVLVLDDVYFDYVTTCIFDDIGPDCYTVVRADGGTVLGLLGNSVSRINGGTSNVAERGAFFLRNIDNVVHSANAMTDIAIGTRLFNVDPSSSSNLHVSPYQARSNTP